MKQATLKPAVFRWYPNLRSKWSGSVTMTGSYLPGMTGEVVIRNEHGDEMAIKASYLNF
tara:strand:+ start:6973 stop:7149 length:177 start_codon:yes stop_codon:yes gene_type:complete